MGASDTIIDARYKGVAGWLLIFCVWLTIIKPLSTLLDIGSGYINIVSGYSHLYPLFKDLRSQLVTIITVHSVSQVALSAFSVYTGILLWKIRFGAIRTARIFLWVYLAYSFLISLLSMILGLPLGDGMGDPERMVLAIIVFSIWFLYLLKSKRVNTTYQTTY